MRNFTEQEAFVNHDLTKHKDIESSEIIWAGQAATWGILNVHKILVRIPESKRRLRA
jgi:hypothetical protein